MSTKTPAIPVKVGQIWRSWDSRVQRNSDDSVPKFKVMELNGPYAVVKYLIAGEPIGQKREIRIDRMRPNSTGYKLIKEAPAEEEPISPPVKGPETSIPEGTYVVFLED